MSDRQPATRRELGAVFWASQVAVWAWLATRSLSQLGGSEGTPWWWVNLFLAVSGPCVVVLDAVMMVRSYRAGLRGWLHRVPVQ